MTEYIKGLYKSFWYIYVNYSEIYVKQQHAITCREMFNYGIDNTQKETVTMEFKNVGAPHEWMSWNVSF